MTQRARHAFDVMSSITNEDLNVYDGVIAVVSNEIPSHLSVTNLIEFLTLYFLVLINPGSSRVSVMEIPEHSSVELVFLYCWW